MFLPAHGDRLLPLCYSMNVHPGESLDDVLDAIRRWVVPLKARLGVEGEFAVGLRLAARAAEEAEQRADELKDLLDAHGLRAVTVNAFPYGDFHGDRVKEQVYRPDWTESARAVYTLRAAVALAAVNARRGSRLSVSTVPLSFAGFHPSLNAITQRVLEMVTVLQAVERKSGVRVRCALEPEPLCLLETARGTVEYWTTHLMPAARASFGRGAEDLVRNYLGVCLDTCHHAVRWERSVDALELYREHGVPVAKVQLSAALEADRVSDLAPFAEERYLHQVIARDGTARPDLDPAAPLAGPVRCHFHVPIHRDEVAGVRTTRTDMLEALRWVAANGGPDCLEIETYTWDVLPGAARTSGLLESLEAEYRSVLRDFPAPGATGSSAGG